MISPAYRDYAFASVGVRGGDFNEERLYPLRGRNGEIWCYWKLLREETTEDGGMLLTGYFRVGDPPLEKVNSPERQQINDLLYRLNSISHTLLSLLKTNDLDVVIDKILTDVQTMFHGGRAYIIEFDRERRTHDCTYEVTAENVTAEQDLVNSLSMDEVPWWTRRIENGNPIIISSLDELPDEAFREKEVLAMQDIKSLMVVPLISKEEVWGYMGIDMVRTQRSWSNVDYQCFSSLANIISICIELRKSELQAKEDRLALDNSEKILRNIYKNLPAGVELYDKDGYLVDINDKELEIFGLSDKNEALGVNLFDNPNIPLEVKERLRAKEDVNFSINYDFSKINQYVDSRRNGIINLTTKVTALYDSQNRFINYLFINIDTTETTNAYTKIQEFENLFLLIGDYAKVGFAHFNVLTRDGYAQDTWYRNLGEKEGTPMPQVIGVYAHVVPEDQAVLKNFVGEVKTGKATSLRKEVRVCRENGKYTWTSINAVSYTHLTLPTILRV